MPRFREPRILRGMVPGMVRHAGFGEASLWRGEAFDTAERLLVPPEIESSVFREEHHGGAWDLWAQRLAPSNRAKRDTPAHCRALERCERLIIGPFEVQVGLSSSRCAERTRNSVDPIPWFHEGRHGTIGRGSASDCVAALVLPRAGDGARTSDSARRSRSGSPANRQTEDGHAAINVHSCLQGTNHRGLPKTHWVDALRRHARRGEFFGELRALQNDW